MFWMLKLKYLKVNNCTYLKVNKLTIVHFSLF